MEVIRKPEQTPTTVISIRVELPVKKELARAREKAARDNIDMTAMASAALLEMARAILNTGPSKSANTSSNGVAPN
jgi:hypothetical protein